MDHTKTTVERALDTARSGECRHAADVLRVLRHEGYADARRHLGGAGIRRGLRAPMARAASETPRG